MKNSETKIEIKETKIVDKVRIIIFSRQRNFKYFQSY